MVIGATILTVLSFREISSELESGWDSLWLKYNCSIPADFADGSQTDTGEACGGIREDFDTVFRDPKTGDLPWPGRVFHFEYFWKNIFCCFFGKRNTLGQD